MPRCIIWPCRWSGTVQWENTLQRRLRLRSPWLYGGNSGHVVPVKKQAAPSVGAAGVAVGQRLVSFCQLGTGPYYGLVSSIRGNFATRDALERRLEVDIFVMEFVPTF